MADPTSFDVYFWLDGAYRNVKSDLRTCRFGWGRKKPSDPWGPNVATVELSDPDRDYDPLNTAGPWFGELVPGIELLIRVTHSGTYWDWRGAVTEWKPSYYANDSIARCTVTAVDRVGETMQPVSWSANHLFLDKLKLGVAGGFYSFTTDQISTSSGIVQDQSLNQETGIGYEVSVAGYTATTAGDGVTFTGDAGDGVYMASLEYVDMIRQKGICGLFSFKCTDTGIANTVQYTSHPLFVQWINVGFGGGTFDNDGWAVTVRTTRAGASSPWTIADTNAVHIVFETFVNGSVSKTKVMSAGTWADWEDERRVVIVAMDRDNITLTACVPADGSGTIDGGSSVTNTWTGEDMTAVAATTNDEPLHYPYVGRQRGSHPTTIQPTGFTGDFYVAAVAHVAGEPAWATRMCDAVVARGLEPPETIDRANAVIDGLTIAAGSINVDLDGGTPLAQAQSLIDMDGLSVFQELVAVEQGRMFQHLATTPKVQLQGFASCLAASAVSQATWSDQSEGLDASYSELVTGRDTVINHVEVSIPNGGIVTSSDATSISAHGLQGRRWSLPFADVTDAQSFADHAVARHKDPHPRVSPIVVVNPSDTWWDEIFAREIGDRVTVVRQPMKVGSVATLEQVLEGRELFRDAVTGFWTYTAHLASWEPWRPGITGSPDTPPAVAQYTSATGSGSLSITKPDGVKVGDLLVIIAGSDASDAVTTASWSALSGWTQDDEVGVANAHFNLWTRSATGTEAASQTLTVNPSANGISTTAAFYLRIPNGSATIHAEGTETSETDEGISVTGLTTSVANTLVMAVAMRNSDDLSGVVMTGADFLGDVDGFVKSTDGDGMALMFRHIQVPTADTTTSCGFTRVGGANGPTWIGSQFAFRT